MNLVIDKNILLQNLKKISPIIKNSPLNPCDSTIVIACNNDCLNIYANNEIIQVCIQINNTQYQLREGGQIIIDYKIFSALLEKINGSSIELLQDANILKISSNKFNTNLNLLSETFPIINYDLNNETIVLEAEKIQYIFKKTCNFVADGKQMQNSPFRGILIDTTKKQNVLESIATNTFKLAYVNLPYTGSQFKFIVEPEVLEFLTMLNSNINFSLIDSRINGKIDNIKFSCSTVSGVIPSINRQIENRKRYELSVNKKILVNAIEKASLLSNELTNTVTLEILNNTLNISSHDLDKGNLKEDIDVTGNVDTKSKIILNGNTFLTTLKDIDSSNVIIQFDDGTSPILLKEENNEKFVALIMPARR